MHVQAERAVAEAHEFGADERYRLFFFDVFEDVLPTHKQLGGLVLLVPAKIDLLWDIPLLLG